jgi:hypothetical protein
MVRKRDGLKALLPREEPPPIESLNLLDWYVVHTLQLCDTPADAFDLADKLLEERARRLQ